MAELRRAATEGKLSEELAERIEAARARTYGDLDDLLDDLRPPAKPPVPLQHVEPYPTRPEVPPPVPGPYLPSPPPSGPAGRRGTSLADPLILSAGFSGAKRTGLWEVPPFLRVQAIADNVRLDCLQATSASQLIDLRVLPGAATVVVVVPEGGASSATGSARPGAR